MHLKIAHNSEGARASSSTDADKAAADTLSSLTTLAVRAALSIPPIAIPAPSSNSSSAGIALPSLRVLLANANAAESRSSASTKVTQPSASAEASSKTTADKKAIEDKTAGTAKDRADTASSGASFVKAEADKKATPLAQAAASAPTSLPPFAVYLSQLADPYCLAPVEGRSIPILAVPGSPVSGSDSASTSEVDDNYGEPTLNSGRGLENSEDFHLTYQASFSSSSDSMATSLLDDVSHSIPLRAQSMGADTSALTAAASQHNNGGLAF